MTANSESGPAEERSIFVDLPDRAMIAIRIADCMERLSRLLPQPDENDTGGKGPETYTVDAHRFYAVRGDLQELLTDVLVDVDRDNLASLDGEATAGFPAWDIDGWGYDDRLGMTESITQTVWEIYENMPAGAERMPETVANKLYDELVERGSNFRSIAVPSPEELQASLKAEADEADALDETEEPVETAKPAKATKPKPFTRMWRGKFFRFNRPYWVRAVADAEARKIPEPPDFSKPTHDDYRPLFEAVVAAAKARDLEALFAIDVVPEHSSRTIIWKYRELCIYALAIRDRRFKDGIVPPGRE